MTMKNLADVSIEEQKKFLDSFEQIFCDMDGVIWYNYLPAKGAQECLIALNKIGKKLAFVSNNNIVSLETIYSKLKEGGFESGTYTEVVTPNTAIIGYLKSINFNKSIFAIATRQFKEDMRRSGFSLVPDPPNEINESVEEILAHSEDDPTIGAVVFDFEFNMNRVKLQKMVNILKRQDCLFLVGAGDREFPVVQKGSLIGNEHFIKCLTELSERDYIHMAKPSPSFLKFLTDQLGITDAKKILVIGDSILSDMGLAAEAGYQKLLVLSGTAKKEDILNWQFTEKYKPDYYIDDLDRLKSVIRNVYQI